MEIAFNTRDLRNLAESAKGLNARFGAEAANSIMTLLSELRAAESINDIVAVEFSFARTPSAVLTISTEDGVHLVMEPNHITVPLSSDGHVLWEQVYRIRIIGIEGADL